MTRAAAARALSRARQDRHDARKARFHMGLSQVLNFLRAVLVAAIAAQRARAIGNDLDRRRASPAVAYTFY
jgi:hypothetical protein